MGRVLDPDQEMFRSTTRKYLEVTAPITATRELTDDPIGWRAPWWKEGAALGWTSLLVSGQLGGGSISDAGLVDLSLVAQEFGRLVAPGPLVPVNVVAAALSDAVDADRFGGVVTALLEGTAIAAWVDAPHDPDRDPGIACRSTAEGLVLDGRATVVEAGVAADHLLVTAVGDGGRHAVLVPADRVGLTREPVRSVDLVRRFSSVDLSGVEVSAAEVVAGPESGDAVLDRARDTAAVLQLSEVLGALDRVFEFTLEWMFDRYTFGRPIASYQALKHRIADMKVRLEASRATIAEAVEAVAGGAPAAAELVSVAKSYVGQHAPEMIQECVQLHGGIGVTWDHDLHLYLRRVTLDVAQTGTVRDHRRRLAALAGA